MVSYLPGKQSSRGSISFEYGLTIMAISLIALGSIASYARFEAHTAERSGDIARQQLAPLAEAQRESRSFARNIWAFPSIYNAQTGTLYVSESRRHGGTLGSASVTIEGPSAEYSIEDEAWTALDGTIEPGQNVRVRLLTGPEAGTRYMATLKIAGTDRLFRVYTAPAP